MRKITGTGSRIPPAKPEVAKAPARVESRPATPLPGAKLPKSDWSEPSRSKGSGERPVAIAVHPRLVHGQPSVDPIFGGGSRPAVAARKSLPQPHPRQGLETEPRAGVATQPRPGISFKVPAQKT
jgi:hypothetical protein